MLNLENRGLNRFEPAMAPKTANEPARLAVYFS
jgi:hypothetical protein